MIESLWSMSEELISIQVKRVSKHTRKCPEKGFMERSWLQMIRLFVADLLTSGLYEISKLRRKYVERSIYSCIQFSFSFVFSYCAFFAGVNQSIKFNSFLFLLLKIPKIQSIVSCYPFPEINKSIGQTSGINIIQSPTSS